MIKLWSQEKQRSWRQERATGRGRYIITHGLFSGIFMFLMNLAFDHSTRESPILALLVWCLGGLAAYATLWHFSEKAFKKHGPDETTIDVSGKADLNDDDILSVALNNGKIEAIKLSRVKTGKSLAEAKKFVEEIMLRSRAEHGERLAQIKMGDLYAKGSGVAPNKNAEAYFWFSLVAEKTATKKIIAARDKAAALLSAEEKADIEKRLKECKSSQP